MRAIRAVLGLCLALLAPAAQAGELRVAGAGSLTAAMKEMLARFPAAGDSIAPPIFGPSGLMRERIERDGRIDLFASADMAHARRLAEGYPERTVIHFTRNRLCALARETVGMTGQNFLDRLLDPAVRLATSTPGADPGGDYAWAVFARAEAAHPGARATLEAKAQQLVGGGARTPELVPGKGAVEGVFLADRADVMLAYCSGAAGVRRTVPGLVSVRVPDGLSVEAPYGMVLLNANPATLRFAAFVMSETGQAILHAHGFDPVALAPPATAPRPGILVQRAGAPAHFLTRETLAGMARATRRVAPAPGHGDTPTDTAGPLLWDVLVAAGAADPAKPAGQVRQVVRVVAADGYVVTLAMAELSPEFAAKPVQIADTLNGTPVPGTGYRLIVPDEKRAGRSARDVVRIDVE